MPDLPSLTPNPKDTPDAMTDARDTVERLRAALEDLLDHQDDYPTDLNRGSEYRAAFRRARDTLKGR